MDKNAIKKYAIWARRELIERVAQRAAIYGITEKGHGDPDANSINGRLLSPVEKQQRKALIHKSTEKGYQQVIEEVAYTWFNRFAALRFMEVNGYLPSHVRVFTNDANEFKPQILTEAIHLDLEGLNKNKVYELENENKTEELFKYILIVQCNALNEILPGLFQKIDDYTELLLPDNLLRQGSVIEQMITMIPDEDWTDQVQIIGWLYQYYNTEPKDKVFADLKKNIKITKENIPAATQLFTPDWIVHYMVENSLGRLWLEGHPNDALKSEWKYYLDEAEQEPEVQAQLDAIRKEYATLKPEEIRVIDPCMGSGHILCVLFDVLVQIYEDYGYSAREAAVSVVENNLWGLDIDDRAAQLSYFAVMMKARQYDRRFFTRKIQPHIYAIEESNGITISQLHAMGKNLSCEEYEMASEQAIRLIQELYNAKEYGSIINVTPCNWNLLRSFFSPRDNATQLQFDIHGEIEESTRLQKLINIAEALCQKYDTVVTNPPYMGSNGMSDSLATYINNFYQDAKFDLFSVFIKKTRNMTKDSMFYALITQPSILFLSSFEKLRKSIVNEQNISSWVHMGRGIFGIDFGSTSFVIRNASIKKYTARFFRLHARTFQYISPDDIKSLFLHAAEAPTFTYDFSKYNSKTFSADEHADNNYAEDYNKAVGGEQRLHYYACQDNFLLLPGTPIAYWAGKAIFSAFLRGKPIKNIASPVEGIKTGDNERFLRLWFEVSIDKTVLCNQKSKYAKWFKHAKGGPYRRWYGNLEYLINWQNNGAELRHFKKATISNENLFFTDAFTWSYISAGKISTRCVGNDVLYNNKGPACFCPHELRNYLLGLSNSVVFNYILSFWAATMDYKPGNIAVFPFIDCVDKSQINRLVSENLSLSKKDWNSFETSWDFTMHPFIQYIPTKLNEIRVYGILNSGFEAEMEIHVGTLEQAYIAWKRETEDRFVKLKTNEEELNRIFIDIYNLQDELSPNVEDQDVTVRKANLQRDMHSFISYAVGCMFGRYSLDVSGVAYAGGDWDSSKYTTYIPDKDAILPICDDEYFADDVVGCFVNFVEVVYGKETLEENLRFIADALGGKGAARDVIRNYFINDFYADHLKVYQKHPIYWLFDSGKKNGFKCLIYMHRYQPDTIARIRTDYIHEQQSRYRTAIADLEQRITGASTSERVKLNKQLTKLQDQAAELKEYEEKIHHLADQMIKIDLDDGVKVNYAKFQDVLAKIK